MEGRIFDETVHEGSQRIGVEVTDNSEVVHQLSLDPTGEIHIHEQDGYPDHAAEQTPKDSEHIRQTRRFAKYHVYRERHYDTLPAGQNPDRLEGVRQAIASMDAEAFRQCFEDLYRQLVSHWDDAVEPVIDPPVEFDAGGGVASPGGATTQELLAANVDFAVDELLFYRVDVYLDGDADRLRSLLEADAGEDVTADVSDTAFWATLEPATKDIDLAGVVSVEAVGDVHARYLDAHFDDHFTPHEDPFDRDPDATVELFPVPLDSLDQLREYVALNLACQIRDCYLGMGVAPPARYRVAGPGQYEAIRRYVALDCYDLYCDPDATITDWQIQTTPADLLEA